MTARDEAIQWLVLKDERDLTADEARAFAEWLRDPANESAWRKAEKAWNVFEEPSDLARMSPALEQLRQAALALRPEDMPADERMEKVSPAHSSYIQPKPVRWPRYALAATVLLAVGAGALLFLTQRASDRALEATSASASLESAVTTHQTAIGERREVQLADGSRVTLNTGTTLDVRLTGEERLIDLREGQATFDVAKDPARPFIVKAGDRGVRAVGTVFDVRLDSDRLQVLLAEGRVVVSRIDASTRPAGQTELSLAPGQRLTVRGESEAIETVDTQRALRWHEGLVEFDNESLREAVAEMNRYTGKPVTIRDAQLETLRLSGLFDTRRMDRFLQDLEELLPVTVEHEADGRTQVVRRP